MGVTWIYLQVPDTRLWMREARMSRIGATCFFTGCPHEAASAIQVADPLYHPVSHIQPISYPETPLA